MNLEERVRELIADSCGTREALEPGVDLLAGELLDSLGLIQLLEGLEDLGIELQSTQVPRSAFRTVESILALCREAVDTEGTPEMRNSHEAADRDTQAHTGV
ncbi:MAG TPA: hypothetical protein IAA56_08630 [Candidatus Galloscillospira excrementavium]|nr:hypothetical protein [Candidatus Galloscillospira excrementavium]